MHGVGNGSFALLSHFLPSLTPYQRTVVGFPAVGHEYATALRVRPSLCACSYRVDVGCPVYERSVLWVAIGLHERTVRRYWTEETIAAVGKRYEGVDWTPYRANLVARQRQPKL
jgi:hypothetical protein